MDELRPDLGLLTESWQRRLRLQDWRISVRYATSRAEINDTFAQTTTSLNLKEARVLICPPELIDPGRLGCKCIETTLVHELIHLHSSPLEKNMAESDKLNNAALETMIECIAQALVAMRRDLN